MRSTASSSRWPARPDSRLFNRDNVSLRQFNASAVEVQADGKTYYLNPAMRFCPFGGLQPHFAREVFANRYGDGEDKVTLLGAMLREIGVDSYYTLYTLMHTDRGFPTALSLNPFGSYTSAV